MGNNCSYNGLVAKELEVMAEGTRLEIDDNTVMNNKRLVFSCELEREFAEEDILKAGHGEDCYAASWVEVTADTVTVKHKYVEVTVPMSEAHGLKIFGYLTVIVEVGYGSACVTLSTAGGIYRKEGVAWAGRNGKVFASVSGMALLNVRASWSCDDYRKRIFAFGDSYFNTGSNARWPYYLHKACYDNCFMTGYPGMGCARGIVDFRLALERGTPDYVIWCLGMNNGDKNGEVNPDWLKTTIEVIETCENRNIIPIICTIPSTPKIDNEQKNRWIRESGCRYVALDRAVGAHIDVKWYEGMLHVDEVHPTALGAQALFARVISEFPEIMMK